MVDKRGTKVRDWVNKQEIEVSGCSVQERTTSREMDGRTLPDTEAGRAGVCEEMCARFERFCALADKHGLKLIVGLITGQMSFGGYYPPVFKGSHNAMSDPAMCKWQLRYIKYLVGRLKTQTAIVGFTKERLPIAFSMKYCSIFSVAS